MRAKDLIRGGIVGFYFTEGQEHKTHFRVLSAGNGLITIPLEASSNGLATVSLRCDPKDAPRLIYRGFQGCQVEYQVFLA